MLPPQRPSLGLLTERYGPLAASLAGALCVAFFRTEICSQIALKEIDVGNLYSAVLSWASIQIGFAFAVYGFVVGKTQGFVDAARDTLAMRRFLSYVKRANVGGFLLTTISLPLAVVAPTPADSSSTTFWIVGACSAEGGVQLWPPVERQRYGALPRRLKRDAAAPFAASNSSRFVLGFADARGRTRCAGN